MKEFFRKFKYVFIVLIIVLIGTGLFTFARYLVSKDYGGYVPVRDERDRGSSDNLESDETSNDSEDSLYDLNISDEGDRSISVVKKLFSESPVSVKSVEKVSEKDGIVTGKILFDGDIEVYFDAVGGIEPYRYYSSSKMSDDLVKYIASNERYKYTNENGKKEWSLF